MMTEYQRTLVEENLDLLDRLILKHIGVSGRALQTYEDYYQIGSEALCRAAMQYDPTRGPFAPLGWRYAYNAIIDHCRKQQQVNQSISIVTDTPLVEAIRYGYVLELQEPSCIANPGVLVGLNSLLDNCQTITLPTGERVHRHPDTVIVVTTNSDYAGCREVNQSVISRMDLIYDINTPDLSTMVKRVMNVTGCTDEQETAKMAGVVRDIAERCRQTMISDGSCGMRELKAWVLSTMITKDPYESALSTIIASASADPDNRADLISTCLSPLFNFCGVGNRPPALLVLVWFRYGIQ